jgi:predicted ATPase with chaperone activity
MLGRQSGVPRVVYTRLTDQRLSEPSYMVWARAFHRVLKLARTIADLAGAEAIGPAHLAEAIQYRPRSRS